MWLARTGNLADPDVAVKPYKYGLRGTAVSATVTSEAMDLHLTTPDLRVDVRMTGVATLRVDVWSPSWPSPFRSLMRPLRRGERPGPAATRFVREVEAVLRLPDEASRAVARAMGVA